MQDTTAKYLIFEVSANNFGLQVEHIREILPLKAITNIPSQKSHIRGYTRIREKVMPVIDLRQRLGFPSITTETTSLINMLKEREQDHINWVTELCAATQEKRQFKLTRDHRLCKFGKWFYSFKTDNMFLTDFLSKFELPHKEIHTFADRVEEVQRTRGYEAALELCECAKATTLKTMIELFQELYQLIENSKREYILVSEVKGANLALAVDKILFLADADANEYKELTDLAKSPYVNGIVTKEEVQFGVLDLRVTEL